MTKYMMKYTIVGFCLFMWLLSSSLGSVGSANVAPTPNATPLIAVTKEALPPPPKAFVINAVNYNRTQRHCMALNIYHEAKNQSAIGQIAVGIVTLNRVASKRYPNNICDVVKQAKTWKGNPIRNQCQYSWFCDGKSDKTPDKDAWKESQRLTDIVLDEYRQIDYDFTNGSLWYYADYIKPPTWSRNLIKVTQIQNHIFYKTP